MTDAELLKTVKDLVNPGREELATTGQIPLTTLEAIFEEVLKLDPEDLKRLPALVEEEQKRQIAIDG